MKIRNNLLAYLILSEEIDALNKIYENLLGHPVVTPASSISLESLQATLDYNSELDLLEEKLSGLKAESGRIKNGLIANLAEVGLKANVKISFLLGDDKTLATFHYTNDAELKINE